MPRANIPILPSAPPVNIESIPPIPVWACSINSRKAAPSMPGTGIKVPKRYTQSKPNVKRIRFLRSFAFPKAAQLVLAAICSTADTIWFSPSENAANRLSFSGVN